MNTGFLGPAVATVLTVYGIETCISLPMIAIWHKVATVLTVYGIETFSREVALYDILLGSCNSTYRLRY